MANPNCRRRFGLASSGLASSGLASSGLAISGLAISMLLTVAVGCGSSTTPTNNDIWFGTDLGPNPGKGDSTAGSTDGLSDAKLADGAPAPIEAVDCVAPGKGECDLSSECGSGQYCDPCLRTCKKSREPCDPCNADIECKNAVIDGKPGSMCLTYPTGGNFCGLACLSVAGCPSGYSCEKLPGIEQMQCVPKTKSCAPGSGKCKSDADCPYTTVCSSDYGVCVKGCTLDNNCVAGKVCALGHCVDPCSGDSECTPIAPEAVCKDKRCIIPGGCMGSDECLTAATHCDQGSHKCAPGCVIDSDCKDFAKKCDGTTCVDKGCKKNWECPFNHVCDVASATCKPAEGKFCATCDPNDDQVTACGGKPNMCFSMKDANDQDKGSFCAITCGSDPGGPCPQGYQCMDVKDDKGVSQGKVCIRPCYTTPVAPGGGS